MSTKIYEGRIISIDYQSLSSLTFWIDQLKVKLKAQQHEICYGMYDSGELYRENWSKNSDNAFTFKRDHGQSLFMLGAEMTFFAPHKARDCVLGIPFFDRKEYMGILDSMPGISFFGYWDNVDPDEYATNEEWEIRKLMWEEVLVGNNRTGIPSREGLSITLLEDRLPFPWELWPNLGQE